MNTVIRPSNMALAFANAVLKSDKIEKVDHVQGKGNWIARRVVLKADEAVVHDVTGNAKLSFKTAQRLGMV